MRCNLGSSNFQATLDGSFANAADVDGSHGPTHSPRADCHWGLSGVTVTYLDSSARTGTDNRDCSSDQFRPKETLDHGPSTRTLRSVGMHAAYGRPQPT